MNRSVKSCLVLVALCIVAIAQGPGDAKTTEQRASAILATMSLVEKIDYIGGVNNFDIRAIPRLNVPRLTMADGPLGVRNFGPSTAYPAGIALAASWDDRLVHRVGNAMGKDARARGAHFLLGPGMNIYRAPMCGRNFEYFGEDPFLASRMAVAEIQGIQSEGVIATAKHFLGNNQEWDRHRVSSDIDERTLREIYLPAFEASVRQAHVGAIMDSYNPVNGVHMTQNGYFNTDVLRKDWGFDGIVMSDWDATYDGVAAANGGLDLEMPNGKFMNRDVLLEAIKSGKVSEATIDEKVRRILTTAIRFGFFDRQQLDPKIPLDDPESRRVALDAARGSIVLLKNERHILPLNPSRLKSIAVIGPNASRAVTGGGGSSRVKPFSAISFVDGIRSNAGNLTVEYAPGIQLVTDSFNSTAFSIAADGTVPGLKAEFFNNMELKGEPAVVRTDVHVAFDWNLGSYAEGQRTDNFSARWTGYYTPKHTGKFDFHVSGDDGFRLYVDDQLLIDQWHYQGETVASKAIDLIGGRHYKLRLEYFEGSSDAIIGFGILDVDDDSRLESAKSLAKKSNVVVLCLGFDATTEGEGSDRTFELPPDQSKLIQAVVAQNKNVIVVLTAGDAVDMASWLKSVPGLIHTWYPGQEGGTALAEILFGKANPSGKLPVTFESRWQDNATYDSYYDPRGSKRVAYKEGIFLGYRHFDRAGIEPLFPFGYGLSYSKYKYKDLKISHPKTRTDPVEVSFTITNKSKLGGAEIAQIYVAKKNSKVSRPVKELKGFSKQWLESGETKHVSVRLDDRAFSYYDTDKKRWTVEPGEYEILVGSSSRKIMASGKLKLQD